MNLERVSERPFKRVTPDTRETPRHPVVQTEHVAGFEEYEHRCIRHSDSYDLLSDRGYHSRLDLNLTRFIVAYYTYESLQENSDGLRTELTSIGTPCIEVCSSPASTCTFRCSDANNNGITERAQNPPCTRM